MKTDEILFNAVLAYWSVSILVYNRLVPYDTDVLTRFANIVLMPLWLPFASVIGS